MPTLIPDSMPSDWLDDGAEIRGTTPDDAELRKSMQQAYREGLDRLGVAGIMGSLKDLCIRAAGGEVEVTNHHLTPVSVVAGSDVA